MYLWLTIYCKHDTQNWVLGSLVYTKAALINMHIQEMCTWKAQFQLVAVGIQFASLTPINSQCYRWRCPSVGTSGCERVIWELVKKLWWTGKAINWLVMAIHTIKTSPWISFWNAMHSERLTPPHAHIHTHTYSLSGPLFSYLLYWFEFSNFRDMETMKYRF